MPFQSVSVDQAIPVKQFQAFKKLIYCYSYSLTKQSIEKGIEADESVMMILLFNREMMSSVI